MLQNQINFEIIWIMKWIKMSKSFKKLKIYNSDGAKSIFEIYK